MNLVIDASVGIQWVVAEANSAKAVRLLDRSPIVPGLFYAECANILWKKVARRELIASAARDCAALLAGVRLRVVADSTLFVPAVELACQLGHPAYDCLYLALAKSEDAILVTADQRLIERCQQSELQWVREQVKALDAFNS